MLVVVPAGGSAVTAAEVACQDLAFPVSELFVSQACGTGDFEAGGLGMSDIPLFVQALLNPTPQGTCTGDMSGDGKLDGRDIRPFVDALLTP
jgi:hypothetical protein